MAATLQNRVVVPQEISSLVNLVLLAGVCFTLMYSDASTCTSSTELTESSSSKPISASKAEAATTFLDFFSTGCGGGTFSAEGVSRRVHFCSGLLSCRVHLSLLVERAEAGASSLPSLAFHSLSNLPEGADCGEVRHVDDTYQLGTRRKHGAGGTNCGALSCFGAARHKQWPRTFCTDIVWAPRLAE